MEEVLIGDEDRFPVGSTRVVDVEGEEIAILNEGGELYAYRNLCPHQGGPVCEGVRMPRVIEMVDANGVHSGSDFDASQPQIICPWHGYSFHLRTGVNVADPNVRLRRYGVTKRQGRVYVALS